MTVTATLAPAGVGWPDPLPDGLDADLGDDGDAHRRAARRRLHARSHRWRPDVTQASCTSGVVTAPEVLLATSPAGITYVADPQPPYDGAVDTTVTITATLSDGFEWGTLPAGWDEVDLVTATYAVTLTATSCAEVTPVLPTVTQAVCRSGLLEDPTLELATTDGITYAADPGPALRAGRHRHGDRHARRCGSGLAGRAARRLGAHQRHRGHHHPDVRRRVVHAGVAGGPDRRGGDVRGRRPDAARP